MPSREGTDMTAIGRKIIILGCPGSGKSTLARRLRERTGLPLIHLDNVWWRADRTHITRDEFDRRLEEILQGEEWIVDGDYSRTYEPRFRACDTVIFLDLSEDECLRGITERIGRVRPDIPWTEDRPDPELEELVRNYRRDNRPAVYELIRNYPEKRVLIFMTRKQVQDWLTAIKGEDMENVYRIDQNTWRIEDGHVRFYLFCGEKKAALIDTGMNCPDARELAEKITSLPLLLINTHADPDHISGNGAFEEFYMSPAEEEYYRSRGGKGRPVPVWEGDVIDLGDRPLRIIDIPGHTPGSIAVLDEKNRILVSGDSVQDGNIFMFGAHRDLRRYAESLRHLEEFRGQFDEIYPMHGSFPVSPDLTEKLIGGAEDVLAGKASAVPVSVHGREVGLYKFDFAGFLCDLK